MNYTEYVESKRKATKKISAEIRERWNNRIVQRGLHVMGLQGAIQYLADYGRGIGAAKVVGLALCAESEGYPDLATGFWQKAFELETGEKASSYNFDNSLSEAITPVRQSISGVTKKRIHDEVIISELPPHLQPGRIVTMQPVDALYDRSYYINNPDYWGQPKRDGNRVVVIATKEKVYYQSRSTKLRKQPSIESDRILLETANQIGAFVLDGELYYQSCIGSEHRTGAQAATTNIQSGAPTAQPQVVYGIFKALFFNGRDLTNLAESERIEAGVVVGEKLAELSKEFEVVPTARTAAEKLLLANKQQVENKEGEVWVLHSCHYVGGKDIRTFPIVRTKYYLELDLLIAGIVPTTAAGRPFSAVEVVQEIEGKLISMGSIGTGFTIEEMEEIARRYAVNPKKVKIKVRSQGLTESGQLWHGRFIEFCSEQAEES